ncbi:TetR/AcrR family transcriptional regulator [Mycobacterium sp. shizuoka-1]|uniref:TetR/AcrR family transcriptional regulator n=1 Tax=Mycobacterium sp. shizuoka-1 TaxID=2039281 RepID=UPI000C061E7A|nr:TetR/AcrR family transcriptional regulator [Mycobacterium sp. shizuoka-1]GAY18267.1 putative TetR-family transcriptional regulator [Mycobacterium sp. shizuoka-1]
MADAGMPRSRRTQTQRTAAMRSRILAATVECLVKYGYSGTSTHRISALAGVTRGAQVHHFRCKEQLVVTAVEHLAEQRIQAVVREHRRLRDSADIAASVLEFLWDSHQGAMFVATMELWSASWTDGALAAHIARVEHRVNDVLIDGVISLVPGGAATRDLRNAIYTAMDVLRGILVASLPDRNRLRARRRWDRAVVYLRPQVSRALREFTS